MSAEPAIEMRAPRDEVERDLLQARALVEAAMFNHRRRSDTPALIELPAEDVAAGSALHRILTSAREEVIFVMPPARWLDVAVPQLECLTSAGVAVRMLCSQETLRTRNGVRFLDYARAHAIHTRVAEPALQKLVLVDERVALMRAGQQTLVARAPAILRTLGALFAGAWEAAIPVVDHRRFGEQAREGLTQQILLFLGAGYKDDAAARQLGLSVRTYRRYVADIMRDVGAASRFQAGARAAELGLLSHGEINGDGLDPRPEALPLDRQPEIPSLDPRPEALPLDRQPEISSLDPRPEVPSLDRRPSLDHQPEMPPSIWKTAPVM
ncbi:hypothetical protein GCM10022226_30700 [Sphaerisporangium flaviroseum]|uniref:HTH luxR-type domain-containing protein n=1 Tax=Sphaerisporangium flaviroseum TaxID=509199 RepID=A0ABP7I1J1_9ACTN